MGKKGKKKKPSAAKVSPPAPTNAAAPAAVSDQTLPSRDKKIFDEVVSNYDSKNFKKAIKLADQVLKRHPNHGETLAMKGLVIGVGLKDKEQGMTLCKQGLRFNMKSHVTWHVYGLLYRAEQNYEQACKCYLNALRMNPGNQNILRDLALLQVQTGNYAAYAESRRQILQARSGLKQNWVGFAAAHFMSNHYDVAVAIIDQYLGTLDKGRDPTFDDSELTLLRALILEEQGNIQGALDCLETRDKSISDRESMYRKKGELCLRLGKFTEAARIFLRLVRSNTENYEFHRGVHAAVVEDRDGASQIGGCTLPSTQRLLSDGELSKLRQLYTKWQGEFPRSNAMERIPLSFLPTTEFLPAVKKFILSRLKRGVPSLFSDIKPTFCDDEEGTAAVVEFADHCVRSLRENLTFPGDDEESQNPTVFVNALDFAAKSHDIVGAYDTALQYVDEALAHTPTILELHQLKGRILKHKGDLVGAEASLCKAREMDLQDRYINVKHTKYLMRADQVDVAHDTAGLFTKHENDPRCQVYYMQVMWQELEEADSHLRTGDLPTALRKYDDVKKHFHEFWENQFDYHSYCLRQTTIRAYLGMLRLNAQKAKTVFYRRSAIGTARAYMRVHAERARLAALPEAEQAAAQKAFLATQQTREKAWADAEKKREEKKTGVTGNEEKDEKRNVDPLGYKMYAVADPLKLAWESVEELLVINSDLPETHEIAFDVAIARGKRMLQLRALLQLHRLAPLAVKTVARTIAYFETGKEDGHEVQKEMESSLFASYVGGTVDGYKAEFEASLAKKTHFCVRLMAKGEANLGTYVGELVRQKLAQQ
eukprot:Stramenopile-MAST_4_protein_3456